MISLNPSNRPTFSDILNSSQVRGVCFPETFYSFLHSYITSINEASSPALFARSSSSRTHHYLPNSTLPPSSSGAVVGVGSGRETWTTVPSDSDHRMERIWGEWDSVEPILLAEVLEEEGLRVEDTVTQLPPKVSSLGAGKVALSARPFQVNWTSDY